MSESTTRRDELALERTRLANERTVLAYLRTAVALGAAGAAVAHLYVGFWWGLVASGLLWIGGVFILLIGCYRFLRVDHRLRRKYVNE